ncbi:hypothetical protein VNO77_03945 [Canavalia gladiata]|uniref:Uncharacterized protein n=1 Tax=Canavalia gladiata TaxID=3824 RepID=A0AAN9N0S3_CANGL
MTSPTVGERSMPLLAYMIHIGTTMSIWDSVIAQHKMWDMGSRGSSDASFTYVRYPRTSRGKVTTLIKIDDIKASLKAWLRWLSHPMLNTSNTLSQECACMELGSPKELLFKDSTPTLQYHLHTIGSNLAGSVVVAYDRNGWAYLWCEDEGSSLAGGLADNDRVRRIGAHK